jgi:hypothetical protein
MRHMRVLVRAVEAGDALRVDLRLGQQVLGQQAGA